MIALSLMAFVLLLLLSITTLVQVETQGSQIQLQQMEAEQSALLGLQIALGELQKTAGPDQRVTATADIFNDPNDISKAPVQGRNRWAGVWDTSNYSPKTPDTKTFKRWLVSSNEDTGLVSDSDALEGNLSNPYTIFKGVNATGAPEAANDVVVDKISFASAGSLGESAYAYWVEDEGVKADLAWNEGTFTDGERKQAARLSSSPGVDYEVFASDDSSPFKNKVAHPIELDGSDNSWLVNMSKATSPAGMPLVTGSNNSGVKDWLKSVRHDVTFGSRAVLADVKNGGLRRDLSLAFEMDGIAESENATLFNQQTGEFVAGNDSLAALQNAPGMTIKDRFLFRDFQDASNVFSGDISVPGSVMRGPSWWLLRDYANLYKRLRTSGSDYALDARAYFPNRTTANPKNNLFDIHAQKNNADASIKVVALNRETNSNGAYAFRPVRASYAPVLLGVNAVYSLVYAGGQLKLVVDPFFIIWNPYDTKIAADKFAVTLENGLAGGVRFRITDPDNNQTTYGEKPRRDRWKETGTDTSFADYAKNRFKNETGLAGDANLSYLITDLAMAPGEVLIYSPPKEDGPDQRSGNANVKNDELLPGMNYDVTESGIFFDEFPDETGGNWAPILVDSTQSGQYTIEVMFNILSQSNYAIKNFIETNLPPSGRKADELTTEVNFGDHVSGKEFRLNLGGGQYATNVDKGERGYSLSYTFDELGPAKESFGILSMLTLPTDYDEADTALEVFSQLNATVAVSTNTERWGQGPLNIVVKTVSAYGYNNLTNAVGIDLDALGSGNNGFYGKSYDLADGDSFFPLLSIPKAPLHSLVQLSGANIGTRLFEPTHAIGNSWRPPYIPKDSIYSTYNIPQSGLNTFNDTSWQINDALFDRYYFSGIAPGVSADIETTLQSFYGDSPEVAEANPALEPYRPDGMTAAQIKDLLTPADGYKKMGAYSLINGAFNVNSTSVAAWSAFLRGNKALAIESIQGTTDSGTGTPFPLSSSASDANSNNGWEKFSRISDSNIETLAEKIVEQVRQRGPFMSIADFVNRRIADDSLSAQGAIQEAIEQADINSGIRAVTSDTIPNYSDYSSIFPYSDAASVGARNNATGVPLEINQANILLPIAPKLTARSDTFKIRAYGEVVSIGGDTVQAVCEATVQRVPEYVNTVNEPWVEDYTNPLFPDEDEERQLDSINQSFGRRFKIINIRWLDRAEI